MSQKFEPGTFCSSGTRPRNAFAPRSSLTDAFRIARSAETDLLEGYAFYEQQQADIGEYFLDSLFAGIDALALFAGIHPKPDGKLHRSLAKRFPFAICYDLRKGIATVVAALDCRQNPASISERLHRS